MLMAHKLLDAALQRDPKYKMWVKEGTSPNILQNLVRAVIEAEKFDFGELMLERKDDVGKYALPDLTDDEKEFWVEGLIPLPSDVCWYEFTLGGKRNALLVTQDEGENPYWIVQRVDRSQDTFYFDGAVSGIRRKEQDPKSNTWSVAHGGNKAYTERPIEPHIQVSFMADIMLSIYLTLMINSRTSEIHAEVAPEKLNRAREKRGETPLFSHRVVRIVPTRFLRDAEQAALGTHASPRLHWRRSHLRWFDHPTPLSKPKDGRYAIVIPRFIVGLADLGVVSHEYRVHVGANDGK